MEYPGIAAGRAHGRGGAAAGEPAGGPQDAYFRPWSGFRPLFGALCPGSGPDRETRCCGPLRASNGGARAEAGPEMRPAGHPPSAGPARSRTLQPLGERVNRTCGQSCSVRRRPLCDRREAGPAGTGPAGPPGASQLEAGQPPGLAVLTIQGVRRSLHAGFCHCHCQPRLLSALNPNSIQKRSAYQLTPTSSRGRPVRMVHGSSC